MKKMLLFALLIGIKAQAQELEGGAGGGFSINGQPTDNMVYKGDQSVMNYSTNMRLLYTTKNLWQIGLEGHMHELSSKSSKKYGGFTNGYRLIDSIGGDDKKLVYAKNAVNITAVINKRFDFNQGASYAYIGAAIGVGFARNNSKTYAANESYNGPDGGRGLTYGAQLGYAANVSGNIGIYLEAAMRYYTFDYKDAGAPQIWVSPQVLKYSIMAFPITFGLRYTFYKVPGSAYGTYNKVNRRYYENKRYNRGKY